MKVFKIVLKALRIIIAISLLVILVIFMKYSPMFSDEHYQVIANLHLSDKMDKNNSISNLVFYVGGEFRVGDRKVIDTILVSGESKKIFLWPDIDSPPPNASIDYYFNDIPKAWVGPEMTSNIPYEIDIYIDENGDVTDYKVTE